MLGPCPSILLTLINIVWFPFYLCAIIWKQDSGRITSGKRVRERISTWMRREEWGRTWCLWSGIRRRPSCSTMSVTSRWLHCPSDRRTTPMSCASSSSFCRTRSTACLHSRYTLFLLPAKPTILFFQSDFWLNIKSSFAAEYMKELFDS